MKCNPHLYPPADCDTPYQNLNALCNILHITSRGSHIIVLGTFVARN